MARDAFALNEHEVVVFWSRKSGNTSLANWIGDILLPDTKPLQRQRVMKRGDDFRVDATEALELIETKGFDNYILARDPYRRIVSAYVEKFIRYRDEPMDSIGALKGFSARTFLEMMEMKGRPSGRGDYADSYPGISFVEFLEFILARVKEPTDRGEPDINGHFNTQVPLLFDGRFQYAHVMKLEEMPEAATGLAARLKSSVPFPHLRSNTAGKSDMTPAGDHSEAKSVDLIAAGIIPAAASLLNDKTRSLIEEAFDLDFRMLGYEKASAGRAAAVPA